jgi:hypothetical protein
VKHILSILLIGLFYSGVAQSSNKKRVLVIPPSRFEFASEFELEEIAEKNETTVPLVFVTYEKTLLNTFEKYYDENFEFVAVNSSGLKPYKKLFKYEYGKFDGKRYNAVNLNFFSEVDFTNLLKHYSADFVIFITWYDIQKESFTRKGKHNKRAPYAAHYLDFDIYNLFKEQIAGVGKVKAEADTPNDQEVSFSLLRVKELEMAYANFIGKVVDVLNKPIEQ